ncbi:MAG TPA: hypothetical protein VMU87_09060 [Stellaceae bacterium]|nr:hypothetical protein [Stellaceae bacterium]
MPINRASGAASLALLLPAALLAAASIRPAGAFVLVTPQEAANNAKAPHLRALEPSLPPGALPRIDVVSPPLAADIRSPVDIRLKFVPTKGAVILPDTFRAYYGWLGIDITDRIREHASITAAGLTVKDAELPSGSHDITLEIKDSHDQEAKREVSVTIE